LVLGKASVSEDSSPSGDSFASKLLKIGSKEKEVSSSYSDEKRTREVEFWRKNGDYLQQIQNFENFH
jgi:hypothetical protein